VRIYERDFFGEDFTFGEDFMSEFFFQKNLAKKNPHLEKNPHQIGSLVYKARSYFLKKIA